MPPYCHATLVTHFSHRDEHHDQTQGTGMLFMGCALTTAEVLENM